MNLEATKQAIVTNVYHITRGQQVELHRYRNHDEVFYCTKGSGFGVREDGDEELFPNQAFIVKAGTMHSLRTDSDLYVASFLTPKVSEN